MYRSQEAVKMTCFLENAAEGSFHPETFALKRHSQFYDFLRDELQACRTKTERTVILSYLLATKVRIKRLAESLNLLEEEGEEKHLRLVTPSKQECNRHRIHGRRGSRLPAAKGGCSS